MGSVKTAISLPEDLFAQVEGLAAERHTSRSAVVALALREYVQRIETAEMVARLNEVYSEPLTDEEQTEQDAWLRLAAKTLRRD